MQIKYWTILLVLPFLAASCSREDVAEHPAAKPITVTVGSSPQINIRPFTTLDEDGIAIKWATDDKIAVWAQNAAGEEKLTGKEFELWHYNQEYNAAKFTAEIGTMADDIYTYYALSPVPASTNGLKASYAIPSVQQGVFEGNYDVMVAQPIKGAGPLTEGDNSEAVNFSFSHKVHVLKIEIPANLLNEPIDELEMTFPQPVTGTLTVDAADPSAAPELTAGENKLILRFKEAVDAGATIFAVIAPVDIPDTEAISFKAIGQTCESKEVYMAGKNFSAGHTTPIRLHVPGVGRYFTRLAFSLDGTGEETLGEKVNTFTLTAPEGSLFDNGSNVRTFTPDGDNTLILRPEWTDHLSGKSITVTYDSESALVSNTFTMPDITPYELNTIPAFKVPYLLWEDFSTVTTYSDNEGKKGISDPSAIWIPGVDGWSAARTGGSAAKSVRIVGHREGAWGVGADYEARMDSKALQGIKAGKNVSVQISFDYSGETNKGAPYLKYGTSKAEGLISGANADIQYGVGTLTVNSTNGSYTHIDNSFTYRADNCDNTSRLTWVAYGTDKTSGFTTVYFFYYVYIDNVKVSIAH